MKLLVCGGRDFSDTARLYEALEKLSPHTVVSGAARGADTLAIDWARGAGARWVEYPANWSTYGKGAGPIRNQRMLDSEKPDAVLACPGGAGTNDMVQRAQAAGVPVIYLCELEE